MCVEYFAGVKSITRAYQKNRLLAYGYDIAHGREEDILTDAGFMLALLLALSVCEGKGTSHFATVCSTWVWMSRASTRRSRTNPLSQGFSTPCVDLANMMVSRTCILMRLLEARRCSWTLEQPSTSLMIQHPRVQFKFRVNTWLGMFGARTRKQIYLLSNNSWVSTLHRALDPSQSFDSTGVVTKNGTQVNGSSRLKETQAYPDDFGKAYYKAHAAWAGDEDNHSDASSVTTADDEDEWEDCGLSRLVRAKGFNGKMPYK